MSQNLQNRRAPAGGAHDILIDALLLWLLAVCDGLSPKVLWFFKQRSIKHGDRAYLSPLAVSSGAWQCPSPCGRQSSGPMNAMLRDVLKRPAKSHACFYIFYPLNTALNFTSDDVVQRYRRQLNEFFAYGARRLASMGLCKCLWWFSLLSPIPSLVSILERVPLYLPRKKLFV